MNSLDHISEAWKAAAIDLGFTFVAPFELEDEGRKIRYVGLVRDFGSENGMLIFVSEAFASEPWAGVAKKNGFGYSCLGQSYEAYERKLFIETLDDWGWSSKDRPPPSWFTGAPWTT